MKKPSIVLGVETSCDETSIAVIRDSDICAHAVFSQADHAHFGGVVPEIASRAHIRKIDHLCIDVLTKAGMTISDISLIAVTDSPGLAGALLVGISFALGLHCGYNIPVIGVNHLEGHIVSVTIENRELTFPFLALVVSGGHTALYRVDDFGSYVCIGQTVDDAAGEAFDKVGKLLGFGYPAGRAIETSARQYHGREIIRFPVSRIAGPGFAFSFSGLKTAVKYYLTGKTPEFIRENIPSICHSFQNAVIESLVQTTLCASTATGLHRIALCGGVACNQALRDAMGQQFGSRVFFPSPQYCTDNAAMIATAGYEHFNKGLIRFPRMAAAPALRIQKPAV